MVAHFGTMIYSLRTEHTHTHETLTPDFAETPFRHSVRRGAFLRSTNRRLRRIAVKSAQPNDRYTTSVIRLLGSSAVRTPNDVVPVCQSADAHYVATTATAAAAATRQIIISHSGRRTCSPYSLVLFIFYDISMTVFMLMQARVMSKRNVVVEHVSVCVCSVSTVRTIHYSSQM